MVAAKKKPGSAKKTVKKAATGKHPGGAPSKYTDQTPITAGWLARDGKTDEQIAEALGIAVSTLNEWKKKYPKFSESLKLNKAVIDNQVVDTLIKRCLGYDYEKTELEVHVTDRGEYQKKKTTTMHVEPDTTAIIFFLCNRQKADWRRNVAVEFDFEKGKAEVNELFDRMKREGKLASAAQR